MKKITNILNQRLAGAAALCLALLGQSAHATLPVEEVTVKELPPATRYRAYVSDLAGAHFVDGRLFIVDGEKMKIEGIVQTGMSGHSTRSPDNKELYVTATYYDRLTRGNRVDVLDIYDNQTLKFIGEVQLPKRRALAVPHHGITRTSSDGRWLFVQNATPATSVTIVDLKARKVVNEVQTPGCWIVLPSQSVPNRFGSLCGDGSLLTVTLNENGTSAEQKRTAHFFDADNDPLFVTADAIGDTYYFVSFKGNIFTADFSHEEPVFGTPWNLLDARDKADRWAPGGYQMMSVHADSGRLYVGMHPKSYEGSHKDPAKEVWEFDLASHRRLRRIPGHDAIALTVTRGSSPKLFLIKANTNDFVAMSLDGEKVGKPSVLKQVGDMSYVVEAQ